MQAGMGVLAAMLEEDRTRLCGRLYEHDRDRRATHGGHTEGELPFGGRRVRIRRPRVRGSDGKDVPLPTWQHFAEADPLTPRAVEQMVLGVSTRNYERSLEPTPGMTSRGTSKSAVSRRFVGATTRTLGEMMGRDLSGLAICALVIDGTRVGQRDSIIRRFDRHVGRRDRIIRRFDRHDGRRDRIIRRFDRHDGRRDTRVGRRDRRPRRRRPERLSRGPVAPSSRPDKSTARRPSAGPVRISV